MNFARPGILFLIVFALLISVAAQPLGAHATPTSTIRPTDDAYVAANLNDGGTDTLGLRSLNTGTLPILKVWYAWNLAVFNKTGAVVGYIPVKIVTVAYLKFNLSAYSGITDAKLYLYSVNSNLTGPSRSLVAYWVSNSSWSQKSLDWYNAPKFYTEMNSSAAIDNGVKNWYSFDLTKMAQSSEGRQMSVAVTFLELYEHSEEQVVFNSTRAQGAQPYLAVTYSGSAPSGLGALFDFGNGLNSINMVGVLLIVVIVVVVILILRLSMGRRTGSLPKSEGANPRQPAEDSGGRMGPTEKATRGANCPKCGTPVQSDFRLCPSCGTQLSAKVCGACGKTLKMEFNVCPYCGNQTG